ncbi:hypothetical protein G7009_01295 [Pseudomonas capeferrum]|nr:hypothetical protein [Pseudomonas capeferrum]MBA1200437.1 hypothetical protein [Pseudomonas capeferrum]
MISKPLVLLLSAFILFGLGSGSGIWLAARYYRPLLDVSTGKLSTCTAARDNLKELATEQGLKLGELVLAGQQRQAVAEKAVSDAKASAQPDYAAANRLQQERTGGDQCAAATSIIDKELGL